MLALCLGIALSACGGKDTEPGYGYGEEGMYYSNTSDGEYLLTLQSGTYILTFGTEGSFGTYEFSDGTMTLFEGDEETGSGTMTDGGISLTYNGRSYLFLTYEYYTVSFMDGGTTITTQSVLNGKAATDPGEPEKDGYVFLGWYADSAFTERYGFNTAVTGNTTVYARFVRVEGTTEYKITYDFGNGEISEGETLNGRIYDLPEPEQAGYTFLGWWVSATNSADELTYRYEGETLCEDTTLYAFFVVDGASYVGASVYDDRVTWENYSASVTEIILRDEQGEEIERFNIQSTDQSYSYDFASLPAGKYTLTIQGGGIDETLTYVSNGLARVSGFTVVSGSILMYSAVENAERYYVSIDCGTEGHDHTYIDNGTSLYYDFSSCDMPAEGITFTVYAYADGYYYSLSSYNYFLGLDAAVVRVEGDAAYWDAVPYAMEYEVYVNGELVATTSSTSYDLSRYPAGDIAVAVKPVTSGYYSEKSEAYLFTKTTLAAPQITGIENYVVSWTEVEGAAGYKISIGGVETTVEDGITSLYLTDENYTEGLDSYEIAVKALAADSANDSPYGETITVTGNSVGSAVSYNDGTVTWQYSLSATEYRITVNDGDETVVFGRNSSPVTLTKSGNNEITIYFVDADDNVYGTASVTVYAYAIVFDARGGTAYNSDGKEVDTIYVAKGDTVTLPEADRGAVTADFLGWYTLPDITDDPDATEYQGDGVLFEDGTVFTGSSTIVLYAVWINPRMYVGLETGDGILVDEDGNYVYEVEISFNGENYTVPVPETTDAAYVFYGWYSGPDGTGTRYTDENGNAIATFSDETVMTLYARWIEVLSFGITRYNGVDRLSASKGPDIDLVEEVTIPETYAYEGEAMTVEYISQTAFADCANLRTLNMPDTILYLSVINGGYVSGGGTFEGTPLEAVNVYVTGEPSTTREIIYYSEDGVLYWINSNTGNVELLYYPYARTDETYTIPETVCNENEYEYEGNTLNTVPVVRTVTSVAGYTFRDRTQLKSVTIPEGVTEIGSHLFYGCTGLEHAVIEAEIAKIEEYTFYNCSSLVDFEIGDTVRELGNYAFYGCSSLTSIVIPDSVETMGTYLFNNCTSLEYAKISANADVINNYDFAGCESLRGVEMSYGITAIRTYAFNKCYSLVSFTMPDSVTDVGTYAFFQCYSLNSLHLSNSLAKVENYAFQYCTSLNSVTIPSTVTDLGTNSFRYCYRLVEIFNLSAIPMTSLTAESSNGYIAENALYIYDTDGLKSGIVETADGYTFLTGGDGGRYLVEYDGDDAYITLPDGYDGEDYELGRYAFYDSESLLGIDLPESVTAIGNYAFYDCQSLVSITMPGVKSIGSHAFYRCYALESVIIPEGVTVINSNTFYQCYAMKSVIIPEGVTSIGEYAFYQCYALTSVTIPSTVTEIVDGAFHYCYKLVEVCNLSALDITAGGADNGYVAEYALNVYTSSTGATRMVYSDDFAFILDGDGDYLLVNYSGSAGDVVLPSDINGEPYQINDYAFYNNTTMTSVVIPECVTYIGRSAFQACSSLRSVTFHDGVTYIGEYAFYQCTSLGSVVLPSSLTAVESNAFAYCSALTSVTIPEGVETIGTYAFYNCTSLPAISLPSTVRELGDYAVRGCSVLTSVTLNQGLETIGSYCFYSCTSLRGIDIPSTVTSIGGYCFYGCSSLESIEIPYGVTTISQYMFQNCTQLSSVTIPESVTRIETYAFYGCSALVGIIIPDSVTYIGDTAFRNCTALEWIVLGSGIEEIVNNAFRGCSAITTVYYMGTASDWNSITIGSSNNSTLTGADRYYYSETTPAESGNWWHYDADGNPVVW